jgi:hypothetical protein
MPIISMLEQTLKKRLESEECVLFVYRKADRSMRTARGTRNPDFIPVQLHSGRAEDIKSPKVNYYDYDKKSWRSFSI